ncbi:unnamed protein product [Lampetra fluviatilis]
MRDGFEARCVCVGSGGGAEPTRTERPRTSGKSRAPDPVWSPPSTLRAPSHKGRANPADPAAIPRGGNPGEGQGIGQDPSQANSF